ncbi:MAG TPA: gamma-glutamyltransferase, partial [Rhodanobacter sp.]
ATSHAAQQRPGHAAIASANFHATEAGLEVLAKGGNAFDAAVAVAATLSVVEPESSGIGGGFMAVLHQAKDGRNVFIDARETAPAAVNPKDYLNPDGSPNRDTALKGPLSAGIPGEPAGLVLIAKRYGRLSLTQSLAPAIRIARDGFEPDARLRNAIAEEHKDLQRWPASAAKYLPGGKPPAEGVIWRDPDQARTLELLAAHGDDGFYRGETAQKLVAAVRAAGGNWTLADLANYQAKERTPISVDYRGYKIITAPPPSSGGVAIAEILNILSGYDLTKMDQATRVHYIVEAMRRAFRDHNDYLGDPDFVRMPLDMLLSPYYADGLRQGILHDKATPSSMLPRAEAPEPGMHTTHFSIIDADGNMAAVTSTVNYTMGSSFVAAGTGVLLNDEMDDFALVPNKPNVYGLLGSVANAPAPGKRMLSSMSPSIVIGADRTAVIGSPGGSTIITQVLEGILHFVDGESAQQIAAHKRFHHQYLPDVVMVEDGTFDPATSDALTKMGYTLKPRESWGFMNVVTWDRKANQLDAASDPRRPSGLGKVQ